jgi:hypothetical protein
VTIGCGAVTFRQVGLRVGLRQSECVTRNENQSFGNISLCTCVPRSLVNVLNLATDTENP